MISLYTIVDTLPITLLYLILFFISGLIIFRIIVEPTKAMCKCETQLDGKTALITGGNAGIGFETAKDLARRGARVIIASRDEKKSREAIEDIIRVTGNNKVEYLYLDLFKPSYIREFAEHFNKTFDRLDILVNNAGCAGNKACLAENGVDIVMQINHIGPFLLTNLLLEKMISSKPSRIIIVASKLQNIANLNVNDIAGVSAKGYFTRYSNSKLCNVLWAKALAKRVPDGVTVNSVHPGLVLTDLFQRYGTAPIRILVNVIVGVLFKTAEEGAQTTIHLCVSPKVDNCSGGYYAECKLQKYYKIAQDEELTEKVWSESVRLSEK